MTSQRKIKSRFAPSPTGYLHIGHAYSALHAYNYAKSNGGRFILRIEDIDNTRSKPEFIDAIYEDLEWLGLKWETPVRIQSKHVDDYTDALNRLENLDLLYPCFCSRKDIREEIASSVNAPHGPEGALYPGTCRDLSADERQSNIESEQPYSLRLDIAAALEKIEKNLEWMDQGKGAQKATPEIMGDVILARKDTPLSYHLCVTIDDHTQNITHVVRGEDLFYATHIHRLLQHLLDLNVPDYIHHPLLYDDDGNRFAKRNHGVTLRDMRDTQGLQPSDIYEIMSLEPVTE